jgi:hemerythrin-like domain-containing protein
MTEVMHPARAERDFTEHEHRELAPGIERIHAAACTAGDVTTWQLSAAVGDVTRWVDRVLKPHEAWEEATLYPELDRRAGTPWATKLMQFEHRQIREITDRLRSDRERLGRVHGHELIQDIRCHLFGLEAVLRAHLEREERFLVPLLESPRVTAGAPM